MSNAFPGTGPSLENRMSNIDNVRMLLAEFLDNNKDAAIRLLQVHGVDMPAISTKREVRIAFLKAIKDSELFRKDAARLLAASVDSRGAANFIGQPGAYLNETGDAEPWYGDLKATPTTTTTTTSTTTKSGGGFWSSLGKIFTPEIIQKGINTGLDSLNAKMQSDANKVGEQNAIAYEAEKTRQMQAQLELERAKAEGKKGMPAWGWVLISVAGIAGIVVTIVAVRRRRAARRRAAA